MLKDYVIETIEYSFDDVPWFGDGESFSSLKACHHRIDNLEKLYRENEISIVIKFKGNVVKHIKFEPKIF